MLNTTITIIGITGRNASRYLKQHLLSHGINAHAVGLHFKNPSTNQRIKESEILICISPDIKKAVEEVYDTKRKKMICLDVSDNPDSADSARALTGEMWLEHQETYVYPTLERQIKKHLKTLASS